MPPLICSRKLFRRTYSCDENNVSRIVGPTQLSLLFLRLRTRRSQSPSKCGARGGLNFYLMFFQRLLTVRLIPCIYTIFHFFSRTNKVFYSIAHNYSRFASPAKNRVIAAKQVSSSKDKTTSMWTALVVKQVKRQHHLFLIWPMNFTSKGPK